jgi:hypothetical protein
MRSNDPDVGQTADAHMLNWNGCTSPAMAEVLGLNQGQLAFHESGSKKQTLEETGKTLVYSFDLQH